MLQINGYDLAKDFAGPIATFISTSVALYLGLRKVKTSLDVIKYKRKVPEEKDENALPFQDGRDVYNSDTILQFCLLSGNSGWFILDRIDYFDDDEHSPVFFNRPDRPPLGSPSFSKLNEKIFLNALRPSYNICLKREDILNEMSIAANSYETQFLNCTHTHTNLTLTFKTSESKVRKIKVGIN